MLRMLKAGAVVLALAVTLAACESAEDKAEEHFQNGLALKEDGDYERAILEFRNVFRLDFSHLEARHALASMLRNEIGDAGRAYRQYLRIAEQYPEDLEARIALSEIAFATTNWDELDRHGQAAQDIAADEPRVQAIAMARAYRTAAIDEDRPEMRAQAAEAARLLEGQSDSMLLRSILIDDNLREGDLNAALTGLDWMLEQDPDNPTFWRQRLGVLVQMDDMARVETQLLEMVERFPDEVENKQTLVRFYLARGQTDEVEAFLRDQVAAAPEGDTTAMVDLLQFLQQVRGDAVVLAELDKAIETQSNPVPFRIMRAVFEFEQGRAEAAIAELEEVVGDASDPSAETLNAKVALARMLLATGNEVGARARVEEILLENPRQTEALKMQANWQIQADRTDEAIANLRLALDSSPDDAQAMTLMSQAYARAGRPELSRDFLSLAVEASNNAPAESIRYARLLMREERYLPAEDVLLPALRLAPRNVELLAALGELYTSMEDSGRLQQVVQSLRGIETPQATQAATRFELALLNLQGGTSEAIEYLENLALGTEADLGARIALIRARLFTGEQSEARELANELVAENPGDAGVLAVLAAVESATGNLDNAESIYTQLIEDDPKRADVWLELIRVNARKGDGGRVNALLEQALTELPDDPNLLWAKASNLERDGDIAGAIEVYEEMYARNSSLIVVANNLASLLSTYNEDDASLERAWTIARRFRETDFPPMQDTYGWIVHRRGDSEEALPYLESAAVGLPNDPIVAYHLAQVYLSLGREEDALTQFRRAVEVAGPLDQRRQVLEARDRVAQAQQAGTTQSDN